MTSDAVIAEHGITVALRRIKQTLVRESGRAADIGAACILEVVGKDGGVWTIDCASNPPQLLSGAATHAKCRIRIVAAELHHLFGDRRRNELLIWRGVLEIQGDPKLLGQFDELVFSGESDAEDPGDGFYAAVAELVPDERFVFMNLGFAEPGTPELVLAERDRPWRHAIALVHHVIADIDLRGARVLDVGCGRGGACSYVSRYHGAKQVVGVDICARAVELATAAHQGEPLTFIHANATQLPLADASFDMVINIESADAYREVKKFFAEARRVLRPSGHLALAHRIAPDALEPYEDLMLAAGFEILRSTDITAEVLFGIEKYREHVTSMLLSFINPRLQNARLLSFLVRSINETYFNRLVMRAALYHSWLLRRAKP